MKFKIISVILMFLLSASIVACSNNKNGLNLDNNNISNNKSSSSTDVNTSSDSTSESTKTQLSAENNKNSAMEAYKAVLQNKTEFFSTENKKNLYLNDFLTNKEIYETTFKVKHFTVIDIDGDEIPEVILELTVGNNVEFYEILHYMNGNVNGYIQAHRGFENLKIDGTISYSNSAFNNGYKKLSFEKNTCEDKILGYQNTDSKNDVRTRLYFIDKKPVTEESYNIFIKEQDKKKNALWYEFSKENIETETTNNQYNSNTEYNTSIQYNKKQEYKSRLDKIELSFKSFENPAATTNDMYQEVCKEYKQWDDELNDIYDVLKAQLSINDMKNLQKEEIQWIKDRDVKAKSDAAEMAGSSMEKVLYSGSLVKSTKERCYVLVDKYMN